MLSLNRRGAAVAASCLVLSACSFEVAEEDVAEAGDALAVASADGRAALALRWAPIHYQDVDVTGSHALGVPRRLPRPRRLRRGLVGHQQLGERRRASPPRARLGDRGGGCGSGLSFYCPTNAANAPWGWDDGDDGPIARGEIATDPAKLVAHYFGVPAGFSRSYSFNPFLGIGSP